jgi:3-phosphoshikimate 1-carboxyvinyltransferase
MTLAMMREFGVSVEEHELQSFHVPSGQTYRGRPYPVEGDASSATYFWAAAAITAGRVKISNVGTDSIQGDARFVEVLEQMGATVRRGGGGREVSGPLRRGIEIDLNDMPDTVPTLAVTALFAPGRTVITNVANLRYKESDRLRALVTELRKLGARAEELPDGLTVEGGELRGAQIDTYDDHRIAMAFSLAGLKIPGVKIKNPGCVGKTFPGFFDLFLSL